MDPSSGIGCTIVLRTSTTSKQSYHGQNMKTGKLIAHMQAFILHSWLVVCWNTCNCTVVSEMDNPSLYVLFTRPLNMIGPNPSWFSSCNGLSNQTGHMQSRSQRRGSILMWNSLTSICHTDHVTSCNKCLLSSSLLLAILLFTLQYSRSSHRGV